MISEKNSVLILGASTLQVPLINFIKNSGYRVIVVSIPGDYPGFKIADRCIYEDVRNGEAIAKQLNDEHIVSILTDETDISVPTVAYLANKFQLPGNLESTAEVYSNKYLMRSACSKVGVPVPKFMRLSCVSDAMKENFELNFPVVMKPEDSQGSRGIYVAYTKNEIINFFELSKKFSKTGNVIVEEFFGGREVVVEGFVSDGDYLNWGIADRRYFGIKDVFIPSQTIFPSNLPEDFQGKLIEAEEKLHKYLRPSFGMIHSEYIINEKSGEFILVETALRGGGVYISSHLVPLYTGFNNYKLLFDYSLGRKYDLKQIQSKLQRKASAYVCFYLPEGRVIDIEGKDELISQTGIIRADLENIYVGMEVQPLINKTMRLGPIIIEGKNRTDVDAKIKVLKKLLQIKVLKTDNSYGEIIWQ